MFNVAAGVTSQVVTWSPEPTADNGFGVSIPLASRSHQSGSAFPVSQTAVVYQFSNGVTTVDCRFTVNVISKLIFRKDYFYVILLFVISKLIFARFCMLDYFDQSQYLCQVV